MEMHRIQTKDRWSARAIILLLLLSLAACGNASATIPTSSTTPPIYVVHQAASASDHDALAAFDPQTGKARWHLDLTSAGEGFFASTTTLYAFGVNNLDAYQAADGKMRWHYATDADTQLMKFVGYDHDALLLNETVNSTTKPTVENLIALDAMTGKLRWQFHSRADAVVALSPAVVYVGITGASSEGSSQASPPSVLALDRHSGAVLWSSTATRFIDAMHLIGSTLFVLSDEGAYAFDAATGHALWNVNVAGVPTQLVSDGRSIYLLAQVPGKLTAINMQTGAMVWSKAVLGNAQSLAGCLIGTSFVVLNTDSEEIVALHTSDGAQAWTQPPTSNQGTLFCSADTTYLVDTSIRALDGGTGSMRWQLSSQIQLKGDKQIVVNTQSIYLTGIPGTTMQPPVTLFALDPRTGATQWMTPTNMVDGVPLVGQDVFMS